MTAFFVGQRATHFQHAFVVLIEPLDPVRGPGHAPDARRKVEHREEQGVARIFAHLQDGRILTAPLQAKPLPNLHRILRGVSGIFDAENLFQVLRKRFLLVQAHPIQQVLPEVRDAQPVSAARKLLKVTRVYSNVLERLSASVNS